MVNWTGYFDHPLGLPMVMERTDGDAWRAQRLKTGPVQRILPTGQLVGLERGMLLAAADGDEGGGASWLAGAASADASPLLPHVRDEHRASVAMEAPLDSLEVSNGSAWQPMSAAASQRRQATAPMHAASLPYLRRISEGRKSGARPLLGWGHDEGFFRPGADTSMVHDAPVVAYDGAGVGRDFNLLYIDEEAQYAVVGMGSASGALYSSNVSLRMLPLADVYLPFSRLLSRSFPLGNLLDGSIGAVLSELHDEKRPPPGGGQASAGGAHPQLWYRGKPLPPADGSLFGALRGLFGVSTSLDGGESVARAWQRLRAELVERVGTEALQREVDASGTIVLPRDLFCVKVGGRTLPVHLDVD